MSAKVDTTGTIIEIGKNLLVDQNLEVVGDGKIDGGLNILGSFTLSGGALIQGDIQSSGKVKSPSLVVSNDGGSGEAGTIEMTNTSDLTANSSGVGAIKFKGATSRDSSGFIKIYIGTTVYYMPVFNQITG